VSAKTAVLATKKNVAQKIIARKIKFFAKDVHCRVGGVS